MNQSPTVASDGARRFSGGGLVMRSAQIVTVLLVLGLLAVLIWDVAHSTTGRIASEVDNQQIVAAYPFSRPRVGAPGSVNLNGLRGKVVVLNFWQSYCPPCTHEAPVVSAVAKQWANKGVVFVGVDEQDLAGPATKFMQRFKITYPVISDDGPLIGHYGVTGYPETFFIDRRGRVIPMPPTEGQVGHIIGAATPALLDAGIRSAFAR